MNRLFEQFVTWLFTHAYEDSDIQVSAQARDRSLLWRGDARWGDVVPDILVRGRSERMAVDAKYKRYDIKRVSPGDLYQLFLYAQAYGGFGETPTAVLVHPTAEPSSSERLELRVAGAARAAVVTLPLQLPAMLDKLKTAEGRRETATSLRQQLKHLVPAS
jgi:5-methylcytosine-specific restriction enzyme subunit McrC